MQKVTVASLWLSLLSLWLFIFYPHLFIWSEIFICVSCNQPHKPCKQTGGDPFQQCAHFYSIMCLRNPCEDHFCPRYTWRRFIERLRNWTCNNEKSLWHRARYLLLRMYNWFCTEFRKGQSARPPDACWPRPLHCQRDWPQSRLSRADLNHTICRYLIVSGIWTKNSICSRRPYNRTQTGENRHSLER